MDFEIGFHNVRFSAFHGVENFEREYGNEFIVSLSVKILYQEDMDKDELDNTVSYAALYDIVSQEMSVVRKLMETVALEIVKRIKAKFPQIISGSLTIEKVRPPIPGMIGSAFITLNF